MLRFARKQSPILVHVIFWPIIAVFVIWGFERYGSAAGGAAAVVDDHTITMSKYNSTLHRMIETYSKYMGGNFDENMQRQFRIKETALNQLIGMVLISEQAEKMGLQVTDAEVRDQIINMPYLQKDGRFSKEYYDGLLQANHLSPAQFEADMREDLMRQKADKLFDVELTPSSLAKEKDKALRSEKMNVGILTIDKVGLVEKMNVSDKEIDDYLKSPEHDDAVKKYYDVHKSEFSKPEEVKARHILVKAIKGNTDQEKAAKDKIAKIQEELKTKSFEDVAKLESDDPGSKAKGGDLGWFGREANVKEFSDAAFSQEVGKVGAPVQSQFGFHLIKVEGKHPAVTIAYQDAKKKIAKKMVAQEKLDKTLTEAEKKLASNPQDALKELQGIDKSLKWEETGFFTAADDSIPKVGGNEELAEAVYTLSDKKTIYPSLVKSGSSVVALKLIKEEKVDPNAQGKDEKGKKPAANPEQEYGRSIFASWAGGLRNKAKVTVNNQLFSAADESPPDQY